ncbi:hypothetical protein [Streptomyces tagetis]|uniref:Uncharacterized protein n=1 Tax=Streptomyces tagetis TaxID=2820809 RepID=A0A940XBE3_9ACTN|nr:hypothetical protein [Streptomyces sp. RG38]MBQ0825270.1 hypothetical protein [Streptomyces sp. RG38]
MTSSLPLVPPPSPRPRTLLRRVGAAALTSLGVLAAVLVPAPPAWAAARVTTQETTADPEYATTLHLRGTGFQSVKNGFGGVYVLFGTVSGTWRPSQGGTSGVDYVYVQDSETKDNHGYQRFVAFPGDPTAYAANGGTLAADGTWAATLVVPGAVFPAKGRDGGIRQIDCRTVQCGVITIGAHGVASPGNETFTPIDFATPKRPAPAKKEASPDPSPTKNAASATETPDASPSATPAQETTGSPAATAATDAAATDTTDAQASSAPADTVVGATSVTGVGRLAAAVGGALVVVTLTILWLLRRRRRRTTSVKAGEQ